MGYVFTPLETALICLNVVWIFICARLRFMYDNPKLFKKRKGGL
jgi:hypothetical protein